MDREIDKKLLRFYDLTPYQEINNILLNFSTELYNALGENLVGLYMFGSLTYGDFALDSSDIDLVVIIRIAVDYHELERIKTLHKQIAEYNKKWSNRLECSYVPIKMLINTLPPLEPRPYYGEGIFYEKANYGNEWIINNYLLFKHGITLIGTNFKELISPIDILEVQKACIQDLFQEWEPKINEFKWLDNDHYQSYIVMNLCRILYTVLQGDTASKITSATWVMNEFGSKWHNLIKNAENWKYGEKMSFQQETILFIKFVVEQVKQSSLYKEIYLK